MKPQFTLLRALGSLGALPAVLLVAACGQTTTPTRNAPASASNAADVDQRQRYAVTAAVLENAAHGPQLCRAMLLMMPPTCSGPEVAGWDWSAVKSQSERGTRWGSYHLIGTWDGTRFTLTEPAEPVGSKDKPIGRDEDTADFKTPCRTPAGGWKPVDPSKMSDAAEERFKALAEKDPEYAGNWISYPKGLGGGQTVYVLRFIRDLPGHEREIRKTWGGPLCLLTAKRSGPELEKVRVELERLVKAKTPGYMSVGSDPQNNRVRLYVTVASDHMQRDLDRRFGKGVVGLEPWLAKVVGLDVSHK